MSEELTVSVRQEVQVILNSMLADVDASAKKVVAYGEIPGAAEFYTSVLTELQKVVRGYVQGGEEVNAEPEPEPQKIEVGDLVRLTGALWDKSEGFVAGGIYPVAGWDEEGEYVIRPDDGERYYIFADGYWDAEIYMKGSEL